MDTVLIVDDEKCLVKYNQAQIRYTGKKARLLTTSGPIPPQPDYFKHFPPKS